MHGLFPNCSTCGFPIDSGGFCAMECRGGEAVMSTCTCTECLAGQERADEQDSADTRGGCDDTQRSSVGLGITQATPSSGEVAPPLDALRQLLERWRQQAKDLRDPLRLEGRSLRVAGEVNSQLFELERCASELAPLVETAAAERTALLRYKRAFDETEDAYAKHTRGFSDRPTTPENIGELTDRVCATYEREVQRRQQLEVELTRLRSHEEPK